MHLWFQNLNDDGRRWFHFRGSVGRAWDKKWFRYSFASGLALKFQYQHGEADDGENSSQLTLGLLFFTVYLTFWLPSRWYFKRKCIATWENDKEFWLVDGRIYGFYFYHWSLVWHWHQKVHESSGREKWYRHFYFHIDDFFLGRTRLVNDVDLVNSENVQFKIGEKTFTMNSIKWIRKGRFRSHIPYSLWHREWVSVEMKIDKPPMRAGKGENSWDLDDDGSFGLYMTWPHERPTWNNREAMNRLAIADYVESALKDAKKYGRGSGERGIRATDLFEYIGIQPAPN